MNALVNESRMRNNGVELGQSLEDYLEAVLKLTGNGEDVRIYHLSKYLGYKPASVCVALKKLVELGYLKQEKSCGYSLTEKGKLLAERICERHNFFREFLLKIGVAEELAEEDACRLEHAFSEESYDQLKLFMEKINGKNMADRLIFEKHKKRSCCVQDVTELQEYIGVRM